MKNRISKNDKYDNKIIIFKPSIVNYKNIYIYNYLFIYF